ncbi:MAG: hypothetical protein Q8Q01_04360 [archaeon]|nr:hypothetical protein [archaeon]
MAIKKKVGIRKLAVKSVEKTVKPIGKHLFFDAGPIITLIMSRLGWILPELKKKYGGSFYITPAVKFELIDRPLTIERFQFEALQVSKLIREGTLEVYNDVPEEQISQLIYLANNSFKIQNRPMDVIQEGEIQSVVAALKTGADAVVMDERTLRLFIEDNRNLRSLLEKRFRTKVESDQKLMDQFSNILKNIKIIRSVELVSVAYKLGLLDSYLPQNGKGSKRILLEAVLWNTKFNGAAVTGHEVKEIIDTLMH